MTTSERIAWAAAVALAASASFALRGPPTGIPVPRETPVRRAARTPSAMPDDPATAWAMGRALFLREFTASEGLFGRPVARPLLEDGLTPVVPGSRVASCGACHATPFGDAGSGPTIAKNGPTGRNTPHLFGAGLVEMIGEEIRRQLLRSADADGNGFVDRSEGAARRALVAGDLDFGSFDDGDGDGVPDLNPVCRVTFVDDEGRRVPGARRLDDPGVAGYDIEVQVFGWGHAAGDRAPLSSTIRGFTAAAFNVHQGLQADDPVLGAEGDGRPVVGISRAGALQFHTGRTPDPGPRGDPDGDGISGELTGGDLDCLEFFLLNHPPPEEAPRTPRTEAGRAALGRMGCVRCHVPDWELPTDRRSFPAAAGGGGPFAVRGIYGDFRRHDLGPGFHQVQYDGSVLRSFRTAPLWGAGSTAPYGHDGASLDLDSAIRRHGGEAAAESAAYAGAPEGEREDLLAFLRGLVLRPVGDLPAR